MLNIFLRSYLGPTTKWLWKWWNLFWAIINSAACPGESLLDPCCYIKRDTMRGSCVYCEKVTCLRTWWSVQISPIIPILQILLILNGIGAEAGRRFLYGYVKMLSLTQGVCSWIIYELRRVMPVMPCHALWCLLRRWFYEKRRAIIDRIMELKVIIEDALCCELISLRKLMRLGSLSRLVFCFKAKVFY